MRYRENILALGLGCALALVLRSSFKTPNTKPETAAPKTDIAAGEDLSYSKLHKECASVFQTASSRECATAFETLWNENSMPGAELRLQYLLRRWLLIDAPAALKGLMSKAKRTPPDGLRALQEVGRDFVPAIYAFWTNSSRNAPELAQVLLGLTEETDPRMHLKVMVESGQFGENLVDSTVIEQLLTSRSLDEFREVVLNSHSGSKEFLRKVWRCAGRTFADSPKQSIDHVLNSLEGELAAQLACGLAESIALKDPEEALRLCQQFDKSKNRELLSEIVKRASSDHLARTTDWVFEHVRYGPASRNSCLLLLDSAIAQNNQEAFVQIWKRYEGAFGEPLADRAQLVSLAENHPDRVLSCILTTAPSSLNRTLFLRYAQYSPTEAYRFLELLDQNAQLSAAVKAEVHLGYLQFQYADDYPSLLAELGSQRETRAFASVAVADRAAADPDGMWESVAAMTNPEARTFGLTAGVREFLRLDAEALATAIAELPDNEGRTYAMHSLGVHLGKDYPHFGSELLQRWAASGVLNADVTGAYISEAARHDLSGALQWLPTLSSPENQKRVVKDLYNSGAVDRSELRVQLRDIGLEYLLSSQAH